MPKYALIRTHHLAQFVFFVVLVWLGTVSSLGQTSVQEFQDFLRDNAAFTAADFFTLEQGNMVVKLLPVTDQREVAVLGVMRMQVGVAPGLRAFEESMRQRGRKSLRAMGKFSSAPSLEDVQALTLENRDIEDLRQCVVGQCKLKMSAPMIERFRKEVDWLAPDYRTQASSLFRQMLVEYVRDYLARGDSALIEYYDQSHGVRLEEEHRSLLAASLYINDFAPEFSKYLNGFPQPKLDGVENTINWTKIKFGLKPVTIVTHVATYKRESNGIPQILVVSKQLYANHYFDSSLALTALINVPKIDSTVDSYLLYTNRSRADSLAGSFGRLKRKLVEEQAVSSLNAILVQTLQNVENSSINPVDSSPRSLSHRIAERLFGRSPVFWGVITLGLLTGLFALRKRAAKRNSVIFERDDYRS